MSEPVRLHKLLAEMGVASRRASERLIAEGRVSVNGQKVTSPGASALPEDRIEVDGKPVDARPAYRYILLNKPPGVLSTAHDDRERETVVDLVDTKERLYPVGRLDLDSEGLMLLTNDGELAQRIMHPRYNVHKVYRVDVGGHFTEGHLEMLRSGVMLDDGLSKPLDVRVLRRSSSKATLLITLGEGRKRQVRRTLQRLGLDVLRLVRVGLGPLSLAGLPSGEQRELLPDEARALRRSVGLGPQEVRR